MSPKGGRRPQRRMGKQHHPQGRQYHQKGGGGQITTGTAQNDRVPERTSKGPKQTATSGDQNHYLNLDTVPVLCNIDRQNYDEMNLPQCNVVTGNLMPLSSVIHVSPRSRVWDLLVGRLCCLREVGGGKGRGSTRSVVETVEKLSLSNSCNKGRALQRLSAKG